MDMEALETSFDLVAPRGDQLMEIFYARLFAAAPAVRSLFPEANIHLMYGLTEAFRSTSLDPALADDHPDSVGVAIPHAEVMIVREDGTEAAPGEEGELVHAGPLVAQGYWNDPVKTAYRFEPAPSFSHYGGIAVWSGDRAVRGQDGLIRFRGRDDATLPIRSAVDANGMAVRNGLDGQAVRVDAEVADTRLLQPPSFGGGLAHGLLENARWLPSQPVAGKKTYTVKAGDTLSKIAGAELKDVNRWKDIWELNRDRVANENLIYPRLVLLMP